MELRYAFDPVKWRLGKLCPQGHAWPGTDQGLRRVHQTATSCAGCTGRKLSDWTLSFVDYGSMGWQASHRLSRLCQGAHRWNSTDLTLRINGRCRDCDKAARPAKQQRAKCRQAQDPELRARRNRQAIEREKERVESDPAYAESRRTYRRDRKQRIAAKLRKQGLTTKGTTPINASGAVPKGERNEAIALERALEQAFCQALRPGRRSPTVPQLVMQAQRLYWRENPEAKRRHDGQWGQASWWLEYQINPDLRLYHREKSKRRKAQERGQAPLRVSVKALRQRFNEFSNCCAYCGQVGDMQIEHVEPISEGGLHDIGNIVPACGPCNANKRTSEMESWYRQQPFFSELRLARIRRVARRPEGAQLALALT